jgi:hypothetical protein
MNLRALRLFAFIVSFACLPSFAVAAPIVFNFEVNVTGVTGSAASLFPDLGAGDSLLGAFTFDSALSDTVPHSSTVGVYEFLPPVVQPFGTVLDIEGVQWAWSGTKIDVVNAAIDAYFFSSNGVAAAGPGIVNPSFTGTLSLAPAATFASDALPLGPPDLGLFLNRVFNVSFGSALGAGTIRGTVMSLTEAPTPAPVPEPASLLLVGSGLAGLAVRWRRRRSQ